MADLITKEMVNEFNGILEAEGSIIRLHIEGERGTVDIGFMDDPYIKNFVLNPENKFYEKLKGFFTSKGIYNLSFNNTGSCFWKIG
ncbi:hypothetical protein [Brevibacillus brevis]|uniref:hypothetical protein n=1 Tax=Brevibacillus brevis TaxID=1393 RepID=UPI0007D8C50E|nr:hypothetical protein [Brevibacillus brevis]